MGSGYYLRMSRLALLATATEGTKCPTTPAPTGWRTEQVFELPAIR